MKRLASAPGKLVLSGEYAVLDGAPAVAMAVDRRAVARIGQSSDGNCHVRALGLAAAGDERFGIVDAVTGGTRPAFDFTLDTRAFAEQGRKIGIGSSAALTAALVAACGEADDLLDAALRAHRRFQGGAGSGVDIAVAVTGGLLEYRMQDAAINALTWPQGLGLRVIWSGTPASTRAKLAQLQEAGRHASRGALVAAAERMAHAWRGGEGGDVIAGYPDYIEALRQFSIDHGLGIFDAGHEQLVDAAARAGLVYKPAGAGGGDIGVLLGDDEAALDAFVASSLAPPCRVIACQLDRRGVTVEQA